MAEQIQVEKSKQESHTTRAANAAAEEARTKSEAADRNRARLEREVAATITAAAAESVFTIDEVLAANVGYTILTLEAMAA